MEGGGFAAVRPSIVKIEIGGALAWNLGHLPFNQLSPRGGLLVKNEMRSHLRTSARLNK